MNEKEFITAKNLVVYQFAQKLSTLAWSVYESLNWQDRKIMGDQFIESIDSVGANIIEGYGRFHYLDKIRFYYISRASLNESTIHWLELLFERNKIALAQFDEMNNVAKELQVKLNNFIVATYNQYKKSKNEKR